MKTKGMQLEAYVGGDLYTFAGSANALYSQATAAGPLNAVTSP